MREIDKAEEWLGAAAREHLQDIAKDLEAIRFRLLGVATRLPAYQAEEAAPDTSEVVRNVVECVVCDYVEPAIRDLRGLQEEA